MTTYQKTKALPELLSTRICDLKMAKRETVLKRYADTIKTKIGIEVYFEGDKTSGLIMTWNSKDVSLEQAERAANYAWQVLTM